ncbi:ABC transporter permease [Pedobacter xixiisoli]|uniref:Lipoprotein-releasing system permease protein n=1 Tax=Pedobacter xixiisoli TaxID=1476464 RepID=A0A286AAN8_9SPHI|nr:FtsX-like permease family protein [Pedobacter xixiisoli]SOD18968.1 lipoprotein-releasing system permease protein [Pedobacter xixiisoli]
MNIEYFISSRISLKAERTFSKLIVRIAIVGVMLSLAVMILSVAIIKGFKTEIQDKVRGFVGDIQIYRYDLNGSFEKSPFIPNDTTLNNLKNNKQIAAYYPFATKPAIIVANGEVEGVNFKGIDATYNWDYINKHLISGKVIDFSDSTKSAQQILISDFTAKRLRLKTGDSFIMHFIQNPPRKRKLNIVGIYHIGIENLDKGFVIGDIGLIRRLNNWQPKETGGMEVRIKDFNLLKPVADDVYGSLELKLRSRSVEESTPEIFTWLSLLDVNTKVILTLMLIVGVINMVTALLIMILERTNMIGMLKAMGMKNSSMMKIFLYNAIYLVGIGLFLGNLLGLGLCYLQQYTHWFKLDQTNYYLDYVPIQVHFADVLLLNLVTVLICTVVLIVPSMLVSRISPLKAIRFK